MINAEVKAYALDKLMCHLITTASYDRRRRERMRCKIALRHIGRWIKEGKEKYGNNAGSK